MEMRMTDAMQRHVRSLSFPEDSKMGLFFALAIPLDDPTSTMSVAMFLEAEYELPTNVTEIEQTSGDDEGRIKRNANRQRSIIDRTTIYAMLESKFESMGYPGRQCLLRSICETKRQAIHVHNGLLGDLLRIVFAPSSSILEEDLRQEYIDAENVKKTEECLEMYSSCKLNIYDFVTFREA
ncbi:uncharacterized protein LOC105256071 isoform X2 [Camponotus floridanus]|nr:uncharacterized protein LOC105256071 isoform X2 [Camponotus floridanus]XP_025269585.1 uncharacterized protein LOC105256071 isoform X2 [Camponotus floridanus]